MSEGKRDAVVRLQAFIDAYLEDLQLQSEEELLASPEHGAEGRAGFSEIVQRAKREAGRRRLAAARAALEGRREEVVRLEGVDIAEARRFIAQAANDARITLAARALEEMSDEDVQRLYRQLKELGADSGKK